METKRIVESLRLCAEKLGCHRYIVGNCVENISFGKVLDEAAERLEELDAKLEKRTINDRPYEWISVEDERKPKHGQNCFVAYAFNGRKMQYYGTEFYCDNGKNTPHFTNEGILGMRVTHWMEIPKLPEPPKPKEPTFKDVFLKAFPKAPLSKDGVPCVCIADVFPWEIPIDCEGIRCNRCWNQPYFEPQEEGEADA